jgi:hypothetical protein
MTTPMLSAYMSFNSPLMMILIYRSIILLAWIGTQQIDAYGKNPT